MSKLKTSSHYVRTLLDFASAMGADVENLQAQAGVGSADLTDENVWLDNNVITTLVKALWRESGDETMGIDPQPMRSGTWALACDYMLSAETLGDLYRRGEYLFSYLPPDSFG